MPIADGSTLVRSLTPLLEVAGRDLRVPVLDGSTVSYANLDVAATAPALRAVVKAVDELAPWSASVHRGAGAASVVCTEAYEAARAAVAQTLGARPDDAVVWTRNTTDALNLLSRTLSPGTQVMTFDLEHHANLLPWRRHDAHHLPTPPATRSLPDVLAAALAGLDRRRPRLVALTGASNVTGEILPVRELTAVAHAHGARVVLDAAQLLPHRGLDLRATGVDWVALSGHKLYAPYGAGALVGRADVLDAGAPYLAGGGAALGVTVDGVSWASGPARHEGGTPNLVGAVALAVALRTLAGAGWDRVAAHDAALAAALVDGLERIDGVRVHRAFADRPDAVGIAAFTVDGFDPSLVAAVLSAEHGIGVRHGGFCAYPLTESLLGPGALARGGAIRASTGVGTSSTDVERLVDAVEALVSRGPAGTYRCVDGRWVADATTDLHPRPAFLRALEM